MSKPTPEELVKKTIDGAYRLALRLTGNSSDAWDLTQEALLKAIEALPGFRGDASPSTWVYRIVVNLWKNQRQSLAGRFWSRLFSFESERGFVEPTSAEPAPDQAAEDAARRAAFDSALAELAPEDRAALVLRELDAKSYEEISEILGVPMGTVKSRLHRARMTLARLWEKEHGA